MESSRRIFARLTAKAWADPRFKARLLAEPAAVMSEHGLVIPADVAVHMHENTLTNRHVVLILRPKSLAARDLTVLERLVPMATDITIITPPGVQKRLKAKKTPRKPAKKATKKAKKR